MAFNNKANDETKMYLSLGLNESGNPFSHPPRVLSLLSSVLEKIVQSNEILFKSSKRRENVTMFHGSRAPNLSIQQYLKRIFKYANCSNSCFVVAYIYIDRYLQRMEACLTALNVHRLLITSIMSAAKFIDDECHNNAYFAKVGGISTREMNRMEMEFLHNLEFRLHVTTGTFVNYCLKLEKEGQAQYQIHRPIKDSWDGKNLTKQR